MTHSRKCQKSLTTLEKIKEMYDQKDWKNDHIRLHLKAVPPYTVINGLPIHFDPKWKRIGISFSGGADSSLLLYILCKLITETKSNCKIYPISLVRFYHDKPWLEYMAKDVYDWIDKQFPNILQDIAWGFIPPFLEIVKIKNLKIPELSRQFNENLANCDVAVVDSFIDYQIKKHNLQYVFTGNTTNPPIKHEKAPAFRDEKLMSFHPTKIIGKYFISPFYLINKAWIMAQYQNFNLKETLLPLTRSCEYSMKEYGLEKWNYGDPYPEPCGKCFFCKEREYGWEHAGEYT